MAVATVLLLGVTLGAWAGTEPVAMPVAGVSITYHAQVEMPEGRVNQPYSASIRLPRGDGTPLSLLAGHSVPAGLTLHPATGRLTGTPAVAGAHRFAVQSATQTAWVHVAVWPAILPAPEPVAHEGPGPHSVAFRTVTQTLPAAIRGATASAPYSTQSLRISYPAVVADGPDLGGTGRLPFVVLMHGNSYTGEDYEAFQHSLSSWGFIVVCPTRPAFDGTASTIEPAWRFHQRYAAEWILERDTDPASAFFGRVDRDNFALMGHSWGGATTAFNSTILPARAIILLDVISLLDNADEYRRNTERFTSAPDDYPQAPVLVVKASNFGFNQATTEFGGSFPGPRFHLSVGEAMHEDFLDPEWRIETFHWTGSANVLKRSPYGPSTEVSPFARRLLSHAAVSFLRRYLRDELGATANLHGSWAQRAPDDIAPVHGGAWAAFRPDWAGQLLVDDFARTVTSPSRLGLPVTLSPLASISPPYGTEYNVLNDPTAAWILDQPVHRRLRIEAPAANQARIASTHALGGPATPFDARAFTHLAFELGQKQSAFVAAPPLALVFRDLNNVEVTLPVMLSAPPRGFAAPWPHSILLPLSGAALDLSSLVSVSVRIDPSEAPLACEIDNLRFETLPAGSHHPPAPASIAITASTVAGQPVTIPLTANDPDGDAFAWSVVCPPAKGSITLSDMSVTYTPAPGFTGRESFTVRVFDARALGATCRVEVAVAPEGNSPPVALSTNLYGMEIGALNPVVLSATDADGDPITYRMVGQYAEVGVSGNVYVDGALPQLSVVPANSRPMMLRFVAEDPYSTGDEATVTIQPQGTVPQVFGSTLRTSLGRPRGVRLSAFDPEQDALTYSFVTTPAKGTLSGIAPDLVYNPAPGATGVDAFTFIVSDGVSTSAPATISIIIDAANRKPVASGGAVSASEGGIYSDFSLVASDPDGDSLSFVLKQAPTKGKILFAGSSYFGLTLRYQGAPGATGTDTFTWAVSDGLVESAPVNTTVTLKPVGPNLAPVLSPVSATTAPATSVVLDLGGSDPDGDPLSYAVALPPALGIAEVVGAQLAYTPPPGFSGTVQIGVYAADRLTRSSTALVTIDVATPYLSWRTTMFSPAQLADAVVSDSTSDPDGDGLLNLAEYALGGDPLLPDAVGVGPVLELQSDADGDAITLTYSRDPSRTDVSYLVQGSSSLAPDTWTPVPDAPVGTENGRELRRATVKLSNRSQFLRLRIERR